MGDIKMNKCPECSYPKMEIKIRGCPNCGYAIDNEGNYYEYRRLNGVIIFLRNIRKPEKV
jgi:hypothetical protein